jgi:hypothetical protein
MKTKDLVKQNPQTEENATVFTEVVIPPVTLQPTEAEYFWELLGAQRAYTAASTVTNLLWLENISKLKASKEYARKGFTWAQVCEHLGFSVATLDRHIEDFRSFGSTFFRVRELAKISREAYRAIAPVETEDGKIRIGDEVLALTKANAHAIEAAFEAQREKIASSSEQLTEAKGELEKTRKDRDNAKTAAKNLEQALRDERLKEANRFKAASPREKLLLEADEAMRFATARVARVLADQDANADELELAREFAFSAVKAFYTQCGLTNTDLFAAEQIPAGRSPIAEFLDKQPTVKAALEIAKGLKK